MGCRLLARAVLAVMVLLGAGACGTGTDAVAQGGTFDFVAPGGQTDIFY
ncbi:TlpA family protein disulfide reductase, partial [Rhodococcus ruber]